MGYFSQNRHKFYLKCHMIFVCKYRKQLINENVRVFILSTFKQIEEKSDFEIEIMETDKDLVFPTPKPLVLPFWMRNGIMGSLDHSSERSEFVRTIHAPYK